MTCECGNKEYFSLTVLLKSMAMYKNNNDPYNYNVEGEVEKAGSYYKKLMNSGAIQ